MDRQTQSPGFFGVHMAIHYHKQSRNMGNLIETWKEREEGKYFFDVFP